MAAVAADAGAEEHDHAGTKTFSPFRTHLFGALLIGALAFPASHAAAQQVFATPEAASTALIQAAQAPGQGALDRIFGAGGKDILSSGDPAVDSRHLSDFVSLARRGSAVTDGEDGEKVLLFGDTSWRFPIPLKPSGTGWVFDVAAGARQVTDLTIGENELVAIGACADYVAAQNEYFQQLHDDQPVQQYAQKLRSTPGLHDGLFWEPETQSDRSPLGDRVVAATVQSGDDPRRAAFLSRLSLQDPDPARSRRAGRRLWLRRQRAAARRLRPARLSGDLGRNGDHDLPLRPARPSLPAQFRRKHPPPSLPTS